MTREEFKKKIEAGIVRWLDIQKRSAVSPESRLLLERISDLVSRGGKRARPDLLYLTYLAYGGKKVTSLVDLGLALEFHHQALLMHDDIMDKDTVRYHGPNITGFYLQDATPEIAEAMGILAGDILLSYPNMLILQSHGFTVEKKMHLLQLLHQTNIDVAYGQQLDILNLDPHSASFMNNLLIIHTLKTASYSTQLPMSCAAELLDLPSAERKKISIFAQYFGVMFQLADDYSDYFINDSAFDNRPKYRDFRQGKITYPLFIAFQQADTKQLTYLRRNLGKKDATDAIIQKVVAMLESCGAKDKSREQLEVYIAKSSRALDDLAIKTNFKRQFANLLQKYKV